MAKAKRNKAPQAKPVSPTMNRPSAVRQSEHKAVIIEEIDALVFGRTTYIWIGLGIVLMLIGMALMAGGAMPSADVWDESIIYSFRRITLAPIVILAGLGVVTFAILKK